MDQFAFSRNIVKKYAFIIHENFQKLTPKEFHENFNFCFLDEQQFEVKTKKRKKKKNQ